MRKNGHSRAVWAAALTVAACYVGTRLWFMYRFPFFVDEGQFATFTADAARSTHRLFESMSIGKEPLQAWLGVPWVKLGVNPLMAGRLVSAIAGLLTVGVVALLGTILADIATGLVAAGLSVLLPFCLINDGVGIVEPAVTLIMAGALCVQLLLARKPDLRLGVLLGIIFAGGVFLKQSTEAALILFPVSLLCLDWSRVGRRHRLSLWAASALLAVAGVAAAELVLRSTDQFPHFEAYRRTSGYPVKSLTQVLADPWDVYSRQALRVYRTSIAGYVTVPLVFMTAVGTAAAMARRRRVLIILLLWIAVPFAGAVFFTTLSFARNVMYVLPPLIVLMAYGFVSSARWIRERVPGRMVLLVRPAVVTALLVPALVYDMQALAHPASVRYPGLDDWQYVTGWPAGGAWPGVVDAIGRRAVGKSVIVLATTSQAAVLGFLLGTSRYHLVSGRSSLAAAAQFVITQVNDGPVDHRARQVLRNGHFVVVGRFPRPRACSSQVPLFRTPCPPGGDIATLYQRAAVARPRSLLRRQASVPQPR